VQNVTHWKLTLSYDGTGFHGWQVQPSLVTIQGTLASAIHKITGETLLPQGSGRTDAGVHALAQVASFALEVSIPPPNLIRALNSVLPASIRVTAAEQVPPDFHARRSAIRKIYEYRIFERRSEVGVAHPSRLCEGWGIAERPLSSESPQTGVPHSSRSTWRDGWASQEARICPPFLAPYVWDCHWPLDLAAIEDASTRLLGEHDFASFAASDPDRTTRESAPVEHPSASGTQPAFEATDPHALKGTGFSPYIETLAKNGASAPDGTTRTILSSTWTRTEETLIYRITGTGFLHHMVRNIVGTLADVGRGALIPSDIDRILAARDRTAAGPTAPASGLFLVSVEYEANP
jgi:tRNA pseudouridine38-40 synthase